MFHETCDQIFEYCNPLDAIEQGGNLYYERHGLRGGSSFCFYSMEGLADSFACSWVLCSYVLLLRKLARIILFISIMVAAKFLDDFYYSNEFWAKVRCCLVPLGDVNCNSV